MEIKFSKKDTFESTPLVRIDIKLKKDSDLYGRLLKYQKDNEVYSERGGWSGPNGASQYFLPEEAEKVVQWLKENL